MFATLVNKRGNGSIVDVVETSADQRKSLVSEILHFRCEIEFAVEPRFYGVLIGRWHIHQMIEHHRADVTGDDFLREQIVGVRLRAQENDNQ